MRDVRRDGELMERLSGYKATIEKCGSNCNVTSPHL